MRAIGLIGAIGGIGPIGAIGVSGPTGPFDVIGPSRGLVEQLRGNC